MSIFDFRFVSKEHLSLIFSGIERVPGILTEMLRGINEKTGLCVLCLAARPHPTIPGKIIFISYVYRAPVVGHC